MSRIKKVLWIALASHPDEVYEIHPQPWVSSMRRALLETSQVALTYLHITNHKACNFTSEGVGYVFLKGPRPRYDILSLYLIRHYTLYRWLRKHHAEFDVIHVHGSEHSSELGLWRFKTPFVVSLQGIINECLPYYYGKSLRKRKLFMTLQAVYEAFCMRRTNYFIGRTEWDRAVVAKYNSKAEYFHNDEILRPEFYKSEKIEKGNAIVHVGGKIATKELAFALDVINFLHASNADVSLKIIGSEVESVIKAWKKDKKNNRIDWSKIQILGFLNGKEMVEVYQNSLCLIHPSRIDNSPNSVCEAQILGVPVIATPVGGVPSIITDQENGFLIERDIEAYAHCVIELLENDEMWQSISQNAKMTAQRRHDPKKCVGELLNAYNKLIEGH